MSFTTHAELVEKHGTLDEFTEAIKAAVGEISLDEAEAAIDKYRTDLAFAAWLEGRGEFPMEALQKGDGDE